MGIYHIKEGAWKNALHRDYSTDTERLFVKQIVP